MSNRYPVTQLFRPTGVEHTRGLRFRFYRGLLAKLLASAMQSLLHFLISECLATQHYIHDFVEKLIEIVISTLLTDPFIASRSF